MVEYQITLFERDKNMAVGKVSGTILKRSVVNLLKCPPRTGMDAASFSCGNNRVLSANAVGITDCVIAP